MIRKPMLLHKVLEAKKYNVRETIGLIGAHSGAGVTHTGISLAFYMGEERGKKTAFLECNDHQDLNRFQAAYEWSREEEESFTFGNITFYREVSPKRIAEILSYSYECFILDFGTDYQSSREEFLRCGKKLILGGLAEWNIRKLNSFLQSKQAEGSYDTLTCLLPCADKKRISRLKSMFDVKAYSVPFHLDPTKLSKDICRLFRDIFQ